MNICFKARLAALLLAVIVSACGGGGGGGGVVTGDSAGATPAGTTGGDSSSPGGGGAAAPAGGNGSGGTGSGSGAVGSGSGGGSVGEIAPFTAFGPVTVAQDVKASVPPSPSAPEGPKVTRLAGGGAALAWVSAGTLMTQPIDASGHGAAPQHDTAPVGGPIWAYAVGGLAGGDWVVAWADRTLPQLDNTPQGHPYTVQMKRFSATGALVRGVTMVESDNMSYGSIDSHMQVRGLPDGGYIVAWSASPGFPTVWSGYRRFAANDTPIGNAVYVFVRSENQSRLQVVPLADGTVVALWAQQTATATTNTYTLYMRRFDASGNPLGDAKPLGITASDPTFELASALLSNGNLVLAWTQPATQAALGSLFWQFIDPNGNLVGTLKSVAAGLIGGGIEVTPAGTGFRVFYQTVQTTSGGSAAQIVAITADSNGNQAGATTVVNRALSSVTPAGGPAAAGFGIAGAAGGHFVAAYETAVPGGAELDALAQ